MLAFRDDRAAVMQVTATHPLSGVLVLPVAVGVRFMRGTVGR